MAGRVIGTATVLVKADASAFRSGLKGITGAIGGLARGVGGAIRALGLDNIARQAITMGETYRVQMDNAKASIDGLTDSQAQASKLMKDMTDFAIATPFDLPGVQQVTTRLLAVGKGFGVTGDNVLKYVKVLGDTAAINGKGADSMLNVAQIMGRVSGQGRVMTKDMNQLTANFPSLHPWEILSQMTGKTEGDLRKLAAKPGGLSGIVDTSDFINTLNLKMADAQGAAGAMDRRMQTLGGTMELFKDTMGVALADGLQPFFATLQGIMKDPAIQGALVGLIGSFGSLAGTILSGLAPAIPGIVSGFSSIVGVLAPAAPILGVLADMFGQLLVAIVPMVSALVSGLLPVLPMLSSAFTQVLVAIMPLVTQIISGLLPILPSLVQLFLQVALALVPIAQQIVSALLPVLPTLVTLFSQLVTTLAPLITSLVAGLAPVLPTIVQLFSQLVAALGPIIGQLITGLAPVLPLIAQLISDLVGALAPLISAIVSGLMPVIGPLASLFSSLLQAIAPILVVLVGLIAQLLPPLMELLNALAPIIPLIGDALVGAVMALLPILKPAIAFVVQLAKAFSGSLAAILPIIVEVLVQLGNALGPVVADMFTQFIAIVQAVLPLLPSLAQLFLAIVQAVIPLLPVLIQLSDLMIGPLIDGLTLVMPWLAKLIEVFTFLVDKLTWVIEKVAEFVGMVIGWFQSLYDTLVGNSIIPDMINAIIDFFLSLPGKIVDALASLVSTVVGVFVDLAVGIFNTLLDFLPKVADFFTSLPGKIVDWVVAGAQAVINIGSKIINWIVGGIKATASTLWDWVKEMPGTLWDTFTGVLSKIWDIGKDVIANIIIGIHDKEVDIWNWITDLPGTLWDKIQSFSQKVLDIGKNIIKWIVDGIKAAPGVILDAITSLIPSVGSVVSKIGGALSAINPFAVGGIVERPVIGLVGEAGREAVIPLTNPGRAMQLMQQSGLDRLAAQMGSSRGFSGPIVTMPGAVIQDATDADLVAQRTIVAMQAAMVA